MIKMYTRDSENVRIISVEGVADCFDNEYFSHYISQRIEASKDIILDFSKLVYLDSSGFGNIVTLYKTQSKNNRKLVLCRVNPEVYDLFQVTNLTSVLDICENEDQALMACVQ